MCGGRAMVRRSGAAGRRIGDAAQSGDRRASVWSVRVAVVSMLFFAATVWVPARSVRAQAADVGLPLHPAWPIDPSDPPPGLHEPIGVAVDAGGRTFVADAGNARLLAFDDDGRLVTTWGRHGEGNGRFGRLRDIAWSTSGLWVVDDGLEKIERFDSDGRFQMAVRCADIGVLAPAGIGAGADGSVWVADGLGDRVVEVTRSGAVRRRWGRSGDTAGALSGPVDVALAADGSVVVLEAYRWQRFTADGAWLQSRGTAGRQIGQFQHAWSVAIEPGGGWVISDRALHRLTRVDARGVAQAFVGGPGDDLGRLLDPRGVAVDGAGTVVVADLGNGRVQRLVDGLPGDVLGHSAFDGPHLAYPLGVAADGADLLVADTGRSRVVRLDAAGRWLGVLAAGGRLPGLLSAPDGIARADDGSVFVADTLRRRLLHFASDGRYLSGIDIWGPSARPVRVGLLPLADGLLLADKKAHALIRYDAAGDATSSWPTDNTAGLLGHPSGLTRLVDGRLAIADWFQRVVHVLGADGTYDARWPASDAPEAAQLSDPTDVAAWTDGSLIVADAGHRRLAAFAADGTLRASFGRAGAGWDGFGPSGPSALAVVGDALVAVDRDGHRLLVFRESPTTGWRVSDYPDGWLGGAPVRVRTLSDTLALTLTLPSTALRGDDGSASTRAEGRLALPRGTAVRLTVRVPGGVRMWHDGSVVVDAWAGEAAEHSVVRTAVGGTATIEWEVRWPRAAPGETAQAAVLTIRPIDLPSAVYLPTALQP